MPSSNGGTSGWPTREEAARFDLLDVSASVGHSRVFASEHGNTWQTLKRLNPHILVLLYQNGPCMYNTAAWGRLGEGWEWIKAEHGIGSADRWAALGARHGGYLQHKPYPNERLMVGILPDVKRRSLIDRLLQRQEFADYWAMKWSDLLRVKPEFPINLWPNAVQTYHRWIRTSIKENVPYDRFVREMLTASGSNFRVPPVNFYRALQDREPEGIAQTVALTFMGTRTENWPPDRLSGMAAFFSQLSYKPTEEWKEEIVQFDPEKQTPQAQGNAASEAVFPDATRIRLSPDRDPRQVFADGSRMPVCKVPTWPAASDTVPSTRSR